MKPLQPFESVYNLGAVDVTPVDLKQIFDLPIGSVLLVRSANVPQHGDHFIVIDGGPVMKPHGLRPSTIEISAPCGRPLLDYFADMLRNPPVIALHLKPEAERTFLTYHRIIVKAVYETETV